VKKAELLSDPAFSRAARWDDNTELEHYPEMQWRRTTPEKWYNAWFEVARELLPGPPDNDEGDLSPDMAYQLNNSRRTIAVDFDGVIADYDGYKGPGVLGAPRPDVIEAMRTLKSEGWKIVIFTTRGESEIASFLAAHNVPHDEINRNSDYQTQGNKPVADVYWDDRAFTYSGDARNDLDRLRNFRTWSGRE
jgi:adenylylsulfate kinase